MSYCDSTAQIKRWKTRVVQVGSIGIGGDNPIRIQSMTTSSTRDVEATIDQAMKLADHGCEIVRVTVQGKKEAEACEKIKSGLIQKGYTIPLVADIHFYPPAAMLVADFVDKVRINPGNYLDRRATFKELSYTEESYQRELEKIEEGFLPLVAKCKERSIAMRIGTNHGSLSDRIMNYYGDTPKGMVESAFEFAKVCRKHDYHNFLFSMKASNPLVMIEAYRLLVHEMKKIGWNYPLHLGVTEAGNGEDGRIKSALGIGALLIDGLGDTIRCSITEDPWYEIDPCKKILKTFSHYQTHPNVTEFSEKTRIFTDIQKRPIETSTLLHPQGSIIAVVNQQQILSLDFFSSIGAGLQLGRVLKKENTVDGIFLEGIINSEIEPICQKLEKAGVFVLSKEDLKGGAIISGNDPNHWSLVILKNPSFIILDLAGQKVHKARRFFEWIKSQNIRIPVILKCSYDLSLDDLCISSALEIGAILADKMGEGIAISAKKQKLEDVCRLSFAILQAARMRSSKTEFIGCPGCGRTLFDIQKVTEIIKEKTSHLSGIKIAIMGCIVNGPGEMADADFGYVGSKTKMVDLYVGKTCVQKNIPFEQAPDALVELIKKEGKWKKPQENLVSTLGPIPTLS